MRATPRTSPRDASTHLVVAPQTDQVSIEVLAERDDLSLQALAKFGHGRLVGRSGLGIAHMLRVEQHVGPVGIAWHALASTAGLLERERLLEVALHLAVALQPLHVQRTQEARRLAQTRDYARLRLRLCDQLGRMLGP